MTIEWGVLAFVAVVIVVAVILEAMRTAFFIPMLAVLLGLFWLLLGNPAKLLTSAGGWILILLMLWTARILAIALLSTVKAARDKSIHTD